MRTLRVDPLIDETLGRDTQFSPKYQNWRRDAKVPILVLNAAALNTGHTWQFTATWMGESPSGIDSEIDGNDRLRRMYYDDAPQEHKNIRLGDAVGASAAVPAVFEPITLDRLYPERIIRLVDGGVCDNQGVGTLLEQNCNVILVSDGSGQMESQRTPSGGLVGGLLRSDSIFQARIREAQYHDLKGRRRSGLLKGLMFVHLKGDLDVDPIDWIGCIDPYDAADDNCTGRTSLTRYGIHKEIQQLLSGIRTDLDSFTDVEAYALMVSGYRMTEFQFEHDKCIPGIGKPPKTESWKFLELESSMKGGTGNDFEYLRRLLKASGSSAFKVWQIDPWLKYGLRMAIVAALIGVVAYVYPRWNDPLVSDWGVALSDTIVAAVRALTFRAIVLAVAVSVGFYLGARIAASLMGDTVAGYTMKLARWKDTVRRGVFAVVLSTVGCVVAFIHLRVFDRRFLKLGKIDAVRRRRSAVPTPAP
jgi:hypothetical protein